MVRSGKTGVVVLCRQAPGAGAVVRCRRSVALTLFPAGVARSESFASDRDKLADIRLTRLAGYGVEQAVREGKGSRADRRV